MGREGGRRCCQLNPSNPSYLWLCFADFFVYPPPPLPRNSLLVNCEILRKNLIPILPRLLWELIRKFSSGAGIYSQIAATSEDESTIKKYFNVCSKHKTQCQLCKRPIIPLSWSGKGFQEASLLQNPDDT